MTLRADVDVVQVHLAVIDAREAVAEVDPALANGLHLCAEQRDAGFERLDQVVIVVRLTVLGDVRLSQLALGLFLHDARSSFARLASVRRSDDASHAASFTASIMLPASARPLPAMSNAVP